MPLKHAVKYLIFLGLLLCPLNGIVEYLYTLGVDLYPLLGGKLLWIEKGMKDGLLLMILALTLAALANKTRIKFNTLFFILLSVMLLAFSISLVRNPLFALIGARALLPVLMFLPASIFLLEKDLDIIAQIFTMLVAVLVPLALVQFLFGHTIYGHPLTNGHLAARIFATFCMPGSFGIFLVSFIMLSFLHSGMSSYILMAVAAVLILLSGSGMSLISLALFGVFVTCRRIKNINVKILLIAAAPIVLPIAALLTYHFLPLITVRVDLWRSPLSRMTMWVTHSRDSSLLDLLVGQGFGYGTNAAYNLLPQESRFLKDGFIPESLYMSLFAQTGLAGSLLFIAMSIKIYLESSCRYKTMIPILMFTGLTINLLELFPINWLYMILLGVCSMTTAGKVPAKDATTANA
jgi:hypothetical protein